MFKRNLRRRPRRGLWPGVSELFYIHPQKQYIIMIISAIAMATLVFSGLLMFRQSDHSDLMSRGHWYVKQGKSELAAQEFERLVHRFPDSYEGHLELGKAYTDLEQQEKAAKEFRTASRLKGGNLKESGAHVALSRLMVAQGNYEDAEKQLLRAYKARNENKKDKELLQAIVDLYDDWGTAYQDQTPPDLERAFIKFSSGMRYVQSLDEQQSLQDKFIRTARQLSDFYENRKQFDKAIAVLKRGVQFERSTDNLIALSALYEQKEDLDKAIYWCRQAYELKPDHFSLKLANMLIRKGRELNELHDPKKAETYFKEASKINDTVKLPLNVLYPVRANAVSITYDFNAETFHLTPILTFRLANDGSYPLDYLMVKTAFLSKGNPLGQVQRVVVSSADPLPPRGQPGASRKMVFKPLNSIRGEDLEDGNLAVRISVKYTKDDADKWHDIKNAEITVKESNR